MSESGWWPSLTRTSSRNATASTSRPSLESEAFDGLQMMRVYAELFQTNDIDALIKYTDDYNEYLQANGIKVDMSEIKSWVSDFQGVLRNQFKDSGKSVDNVNKAVNNINDFMKLYKETEQPRVDAFKDKLTKLSIIKENAETKAQIDNMITNIQNTRARQRYFEYGYIQMHVFLYIFLQHSLGTVQNFVSKTLAMTKNHNDTGKQELVELVKMLLEIINTSDMFINTKEKETLNALANTTVAKVNQQSAQLETFLKEQQKATPEKLQKMLQKATDLKASQSKPTVGGALTRSGSAMPKSFYDISAARK